MYAVKANPAIPVLDQIYAAGIRHFDTASLAEIELVRGRSGSRLSARANGVRLRSGDRQL
jgi:ornithine decarboxylase